MTRKSIAYMAPENSEDHPCISIVNKLEKGNPSFLP